jgi:hypothetical protein
MYGMPGGIAAPGAGAVRYEERSVVGLCGIEPTRIAQPGHRGSAEKIAEKRLDLRGPFRGMRT